MQGEKSQQTKFTEEAIHKLQKELELPIKQIDERLSSKQVKSRDHQIKKSKKALDSASAQILLQTHLDSKA